MRSGQHSRAGRVAYFTVLIVLKKCYKQCRNCFMLRPSCCKLQNAFRCNSSEKHIFRQSIHQSFLLLRKFYCKTVYLLAIFRNYSTELVWCLVKIFTIIVFDGQAFRWSESIVDTELGTSNANVHQPITLNFCVPILLVF